MDAIGLINECMKKNPETSSWKLTYRNILERDLNPDGYNVFFVLNKDEIEAQRSPVFYSIPDPKYIA